MDQADGVAIGSTLELALANLCMGYNEKQRLEFDRCRLVKFTVGMWAIFFVFLKINIML